MNKTGTDVSEKLLQKTFAAQAFINYFQRSIHDVDFYAFIFFILCCGIAYVEGDLLCSSNIISHSVRILLDLSRLCVVGLFRVSVQASAAQVDVLTTALRVSRCLVAAYDI